MQYDSFEDIFFSFTATYFMSDYFASSNLVLKCICLNQRTAYQASTKCSSNFQLIRKSMPKLSAKYYERNLNKKAPKIDVTSRTAMFSLFVLELLHKSPLQAQTS